MVSDVQVCIPCTVKICFVVPAQPDRCHHRKPSIMVSPSTSQHVCSGNSSNRRFVLATGATKEGILQTQLPLQETFKDGESVNQSTRLF
jgi:hypothetical protein